MNYTKIPADAFKNIQMNAGILVDSFAVETKTIGNIIGATSGGVNFVATPTYQDMGEDVDNCPKNTKELKKLKSWEAKLTGTFVTVTAGLAKTLIGSADVDADDNSHIVPRNDIEDADFTDVWWVGDYSDVNSGNEAGFCAIHLMNALSTGGFQIQSADDGKGTFAFEFTGHYEMAKPDEVPFEVYVQAGE